MVKCQARVSVNCEKNIPKGKKKIINGLNVCGKCYEKLKFDNEKKRDKMS